MDSWDGQEPWTFRGWTQQMKHLPGMESTNETEGQWRS